MAGMLEFWRSLLRQSNPSTLTVAGLRPNETLAQPPLRAEEGDDGTGYGGAGKGATFSPNRESWTIGLAARLGGDPLKNGGEDATSTMLGFSFMRIRSRRSDAAFESETSCCGFMCHRIGLTGLLARIPTRRGRGQTTGSFDSDTKAALPIISSRATKAFCWRLK